MKQSKKHYLTKIGIIIGAISPATLVASSSDTKSTNAESTLESVIQNLDATPFASLIQTTGGSPSNLASSISQADVIGKLKLVSSFTSLGEAEKAKLSDSDVAISSENDLGVLEITIENHGAQKVILVHGFKLENVDPTIKFLIKWLNKEWVYYKNGIGTLLPSELANTPYSDSQWRDIFESFFDRVISSKQKQINTEGLTTKQLNDAKLKVATNVNYYITAIKPYDSFGILSLTVKYEKEVKQINISNFKSQKDKLLPSEITKKHLQLYLWSINGWSNKKRKAVTEDLITITKRDEDLGQLEFRIPLIDKKGVYDASSPRRHKYTISGLKTNAKVLANAIQALLENALDGKGDDTKLPSAITEPNVLDWIKALSAIDDLTDDQKDLLIEGNIALTNDDDAGTLEVTINGHGEAITFRISGFKTNAKVLANAIQDLAENALDDNGDDTKLPSAITSTNVLDWIKALANINSLTNDQKALLQEGNIGLNDDDSAGTLEVTINGHGDAKTFRITGFQTEAEANVVAANTAIDALTVASITAPTKKTTVAFGETPEDDNFNPPSLAGYTFTFARATSVSASGTSDATYSVTKTGVVGAKTRELLFPGVDGFQTISDANKAKTSKVVQDLLENALDGKGDATKLPSAITRLDVLGWIKALAAIDDLTNDQKALLIEGNIALTDDDDAGTLIVTINGHGSAKEFNPIIGFKTNAQVEAETKIANDKAQFTSFTQTLDDATDRINDGDVDKGSLEALGGHRLLPAETTGVTRTYNIKTNPAGQATVTVTFTSGEFKDTANYEINNFKTVAQTTDEKALMDAIKSLANNALNRLSDAAKLPSEIERKAVYDALKGLVAISNLSPEQQALLVEGDITLTPKNSEGNLDVTIDNHGEAKTLIISGFKTTTKKAIETDKALFASFGETLTKAADRINDGDVDKDALENLEGHRSFPAETSGVTRTFIINTDPDGLATVTVTFTSGEDGDTVNYKITGFKTTAQVEAEEKIAIDKAQFDSFTQTLDAGVNRLNNGNVNKDILEGLSGHKSLPAETTGVTRTYNIKTNPAGQATVTVTFTSGEFKDTANYEINNFKTAAQTADEKALIDAIKGLANDVLDGKGDRTKLPSEITRTSVLGWIKSLATINSLTNDQKALLIEGNIGLNDDDSAGTLEVTINGHGDAKTFRISGFQTEADANVVAANTAIDALTIASITAPTSKTTVAFEETPEDDNFNPPWLAGYTFTFVGATSVSASGTSDATYSVTKTGVVGAKTRELLFRGVTGFQTEAEANVVAANTAIDALTVASITAPTKKTTVAFGETPEDDNFNPPSLAGYTFTFARATSVSASGTSDATYSVTKTGVVGAKTRELLFPGVDGFQTISDANKAKTSKVVQDLLENALDGKGDATKLPSAITRLDVLGWIKALATIDDLTNDQKALLIEGNIALTDDDDAGTLIVTINGHGSAKEFNPIIGFKTNAQVEAETKIANDKAQFTSFTQTLDDATDRINDGDVDKGSLEALGGHRLLPAETTGVTRTYNIKTNPAGQATVTVTFTSGEFKDTANYEINNFKTAAQTADEKALMDAIKSLASNALNHLSDAAKLPSEIERKAIYDALKGLVAISNLSPEQQALLVEGDITLTPKNSEGNLDVTIENHGEAKTLIISGFKTTTKKAIETDKALFASFGETLTKAADRINDGDVDKDALENLEGHRSFPAETSGVTRTFIINTDPDGLATVTVTFTSGEDGDTVNYKITGFKTTAQVEAEEKIAIDKAQFDSFTQTLDAGVNRLNNGNVNKDTLEGLSGHKSLPVETTGVTRTYNIKTNPAGQATVTVTFTSGEFKDTANYEINNFKTAAQTADEKALIDAIKGLANDVLDGKGDRTKLPSEITRTSVLGWIKALATINSLTNDQKALLIEGNIGLNDDDSAGTLEVTINGHGDAKTFRISGFQTEADANVVAANTAIDALTIASITAPTSKTTVAFGETPEDDNFNPPWLAGYTFTFARATSVSASGTSDATYSVTKTGVVGAKTRELLFRGVTGFQTEAEANVVAANTAIDALTVASITAPTKKTTVAFGETPEDDNFNPPSLAGYTFTFARATSVSASGTSDATYSVTKTGVVGAKTRELLFPGVDGFQTISDANKAKTSKVVQDLLENAFDGKGDATKLPSAITRLDVLGWIKALAAIDDLTNDQKALLIEGNIALTDDDDAGTLIVTINGHGSAKEFNPIIGFKTNAQVEAETKIANDKAQFTSFTQTLDDATDRINDGDVDKGSLEALGGHRLLPAETTGVTRTYNIKTNPAGQATVTVTFTSGEFKDTANYEINNFKTVAQTTDEKALMDAIKSLANNALNRLSDAAKLPSEIERKAVYDALKGLVAISNLSPEQQALLVEGDITLTPKNSEGNLDVTIDNHGEAKTLIISGFKTTTKKAIETDKALFASFGETLTKAADRINDGDVDKDALENLEGHRSFPAETSGVTRTFIINTDPDGLATVTVTFTSGEDGDTVNYKITGFKTTAQVEAEEKIAIDKAQFDSFTQTLDAGVNRLNNGNVNKDILEGLSGHKSLPAETTGVTRTYNINTNPAGQATVTVTFTSGEFKDTANYEINNFKTAAQTADEKALIDAIKGLANDVLDGKGDHTKLPSEITRTSVLGWIKALATINSLTNDQKALLIEGNIGLNDDDSAGTLEVTINGHGDAKTFRISGFQTEADANVVAANTAIDALTIASITAPTSKTTVAFEETPEDDNFNPPSLAGYTFTFVSATSVSASGTSDATYSVTKTGVVGAKTRELLFRGVTGFQTEAEANVVAANTAIDALTVASIIAPTKKTTVAFGETPEDDNFNPPSLAGYTFTFARATSVSASGTSDATYSVTKTGVVGAKTRELLFPGVDGFQTISDANKAKTSKVVQDLLENALDGKGDATKLPSAITRLDVLGWIKALAAIDDLTNDQKALLIEGNIALTNDDDAGTLIVTINGHGSAKEFNPIIGFKTNAQVEAETKIANDKAQFTSFTQTLDAGVNRLEDGPVSKVTLEGLSGHNSLPVAIDSVARTFSITTDPSGQATVTITFTSDGFSSKTNYIINNFKTAAQTADEKALIDAIKSLANDVLDDLSNNDRLPDEINRKDVLDALKGRVAISNLSPEQQALLVEGDIALVPNNDAGTLEVTINNHGQAKTLTISGFKTNNKALEDAIQGLAENALASNGDATKLPSAITSTIVLGWIKALATIDGLNDNQKNLLLESHINLVQNDNDGTLQVTINDHGMAKSFTTIGGFQTTAKKAIETDKSQFVGFTQTLDDGVNRLEDGIVSKATLEGLSGHNSLPEAIAGVTRTYNINTNQDGLATVTVTFVNGADRGTIDYEITGFKTTAQTNLEAINNAIQGLEDNALNGLANANTFPGDINAKEVLDHIKTLAAISTLSNEQQALLLENDIQLIANNGNGNLRVTIARHGQDKIFAITGFKQDTGETLTSDSDDDSEGLSLPALIGIIAGSIVGLGLGGYLIYYLIKKRK